VSECRLGAITHEQTERAEALARAIDERISGKEGKQGGQVKGGTVRSSMNSADARGQGGGEAGQYSDQGSAASRQLSDEISEETADSEAPVDNGSDEMHDIVSARRRVAEDIHELAERHREDVWRRVQERIANQRPKRRRGIFWLLRSRAGYAGPEHGRDYVSQRQILAPGLARAGHQPKSRVRSDPGNRHRSVL